MMLKQLLLAFLLLSFLSNNTANKAFEADSDISSQDSVINQDITHLILQGNEQFTMRNYDSAIFYFHEADRLATLSDDFNSAAMSKHNSGLSYFRMGEYIHCRESFEQAIELSKKEGGELTTAHYQISLGALYQKQDMLELSMRYSMKALDIAEKYDEKNLMAVAYNSIAGIQNTLGDYISALDYYSKVVIISSETEDLSGLAKAYNNIGNVYRDWDSLILSKKYYFQSLEIKQSKNDISSLISTYKNIGDICLLLNQIDSANSYYLTALQSANTIGHRSKKVMILIALTELEIQKGNLKVAMLYLEKISALEMESISNDLLLSFYRLSKQVYIAISQYEKAIEFSELYDLKKDEIFDAEKTKGLNELRFQYETDKKDQTIVYLNEVDVLKSQSINIRNRGIAIMVISLLLISILALGLFRAYSRKKKDNEYIKLLMKEARHRTQNNLQLLSSILRLYSDQVNEEHRDAVLSAEHRVQSIVLLNHQLEVEKNTNHISLGDYIQSLAESLIEVYTLEDQVQLEMNLSDIQMPAHQAIHLGLIANELITNSLKYAFPNIPQPQIRIDCIILEDNRCQFTIRDNGVGLKSDWQDQASTSFGMGLIKDLSEQLYGDLLIENRDGFYFQLIFQMR